VPADRHPGQPLWPLLRARRHQGRLRGGHGLRQDRPPAVAEKGGSPMSGGESHINAVLARLDLAPLNPGAWSGSQGWAGGANVPLLSVRNPATGTLIAQVRPAGPQEYDAVISSAVTAAAAWRMVPAPK